MSFDKANESGHTGDDGKNAQMAESEPKASPAVGTQEEKQTPEGELPAPFHGFDESGENFIIKVNVRYGYIFTLGWIQKSADWLKMFVARQQMEEEKKKIIKPNASQKGRGLFNLFNK